ncbi:rRNA methyltransferase 1, mitochondrial [Lingula anatina]|uniref:rRNA methyltransferase 1, mitochondrial n=1 Tax=Lingula anatina TaxID=7574 RepID=A0A1S3IPI0_LINAN|nr:rRNA methyltransferase 1, mitochondrial [Lingula anatina]|eukprot:XP_013399449.1 rRNA methyltransferase 1, mitochondrial [Lingula anatina]
MINASRITFGFPPVSLCLSRVFANSSLKIFVQSDNNTPIFVRRRNVRLQKRNCSKYGRHDIKELPRRKFNIDRKGLGQVSRPDFFRNDHQYDMNPVHYNTDMRKRKQDIPVIRSPLKPWHEGDPDETSDKKVENEVTGAVTHSFERQNARGQWRPGVHEQKNNSRPRFISKRQIKNLNVFDMPEKAKSEIISRTISPKIRGTCLFGLYPVLLALQQGRRKLFHKFYMKDDLIDSDREIIKQLLEAAAMRNLTIVPTSNGILDVLSNFRPHQGVCLDCDMLLFEPLDFAQLRQQEFTHHQVWLLLNQIVDTMNMGGIIRTAYYLGIDKILSSQFGCKLTPTASKTSAGTLEITPVYGVEDVPVFLNEARDANWAVIGTCTTGIGQVEEQLVSDQQHMPLHEFTLDKNTVIIMGNEAKGLPEDVEKLCTTILSVPPGKELNPLVDSLNVSVVTGIILYTIMQSRLKMA